MGWKLSNWAESTLVQEATDAATTIYIDADEVDLLPTLVSPHKAKAVLFDGTYREIINITAWNTDGTLTVERAQESTSARAWGRGTRFIHTPTAAILQVVLDAVSAVRFAGTCTNVGNAYTVTLTSGAVLPSFAEGEEVSFIISADNTGAATLVVTDGTTSVAAKDIVHQDGQALEDGDLQANWLAIVRYNAVAGDWFLISHTSFNEHAYQINDGPVPAVNRHPNGKLDYWRAGTSFSSPASGTETADGWYVSYDGTIGTFTISRQSFTLGQTTVPGNPKFYYRWDHTSAGSGSTYRRIVIALPGVHWRQGEKVTWSIWLKADASRNVTRYISQSFGTGGAPSSDVTVTTDTWALTTSWQKFEVTTTMPSIAGKTLGSNGDDYIYLVLALPLNVTMTIDAAMGDIRPGHIAGLQSDTFPVPWWLGGTGGSYANQADFITDLNLYTITAWSAAYPDLIAIEALASTGIAVRTAATTWAQRTLQAPAAGFTITNPAGVAGDPTFVLADDLAALEAMASTGLVARTATATYAQRTVTGPAAGISVSNGDGVAGNPTLALANDLAALEAMASTGLVSRTASETYAQRAITAPAAGITVSNGDGVSGNPTLALANDLAALEALASTGIACRTASDSWAQRTITGDTGLSITNPGGVAGNINIGLGTALTNYVADPLSAAELASITAAFGTAAFKNTSTSGNNVPLLDGVNTWSAAQTLCPIIPNSVSFAAGAITSNANYGLLYISRIAGAIAQHAWYDPTVTTELMRLDSTPTLWVLNTAVLTTATGAQLAAANTFTAQQTISSGATNVPLITDATSSNYSQVKVGGSTKGYFGSNGTDLIWLNSSATTVLTLKQSGDLELTAAPTSLATNSAGFRGLGVRNVQDSAYTFILGDAGRSVTQGATGAPDYTIPPVSSVAWPAGTVITIWAYDNVDIVRGVGVTLYWYKGIDTTPTNAAVQLLAGSVGVIHNIEGGNDWYGTGPIA